MPDPSPENSKYVRVIDISERALAVERARAAMETLDKSSERLPAATADTLPARARAALDATGWTSLTPVQQRAIPYLLERRDLIVQSRTGSGKTGAFLLPLFEILHPQRKEVQALILAPTRELARQVHEEFRRMRGNSAETAIDAALVYGGVRYGPQIKALKEGAQLVVGTPGRVIDLLEQGHMSFQGLHVLVMDEADEMLSMGFYPAMKALKRHLPTKRNSYMFSATIPIRVQNLAEEFLTEPGFLGLSAGDESVETSEHRYYIVPPMERDTALISLIEMENPDSAIIFANTKRDVEYLAAFLKNYGHDAAEISGDLSQKNREAVMQRLKDGELRLLVATDVAARGIDVSDLGHVFMYDVPENTEYYIHRSGRTARAGRSGTVHVLATMLTHASLKATAKRYGVELDKRELPTPEQVNAIVSERMTVFLEGAFRTLPADRRKAVERLIPVARTLAGERPELLALLVDDFYHEQMHRREEDRKKRIDQNHNADELPALLRSSYDDRKKMVRERTARFLPMTKELGEEEPELLAMLLSEFDLKASPVRPTPKTRENKGRSEGRSKRSRDDSRRKGRRR